MTDVVSEAESRYGEHARRCAGSRASTPTPRSSSPTPPAGRPIPATTASRCGNRSACPTAPPPGTSCSRAAREIRSSQGIQLGIGMSQEIDSNMAGLRADLVVRRLRPGRGRERGHQLARDDRRGRVHGRAVQRGDDRGGLRLERRVQQPGHGRPGRCRYILNSISAYRTAQEQNPAVADDVFFVPALEGPATALAAQHVLYNWIVPNHAANPDAAQEFLLHYTAQLRPRHVQLEALRLPGLHRAGPQPRRLVWRGSLRLQARRQARVPDVRRRRRSGRPTSATPDRPTPPSARCSAPT